MLPTMGDVVAVAIYVAVLLAIFAVRHRLED